MPCKQDCSYTMPSELVFLDPLKSLFDEAAQHMLDAKWMNFYNALPGPLTFPKKAILPCPDLESLPPQPYSFPFTPYTKREQTLRWQRWETDFVNTNRNGIEKNLHTLERHLIDELAVWNEHHSKRNEQLNFNAMYLKWRATVENLSLREFVQLNVRLETVRQFLDPEYEAVIKRYKLDIEKETKTLIANPSTSAYSTFSLRQIALFYIYQGKVINRGENAKKIARSFGLESGERLHRLYQKFSRTTDRTGVEGKEIISFIADLEKVIPHLNGAAKTQAETEKNTISKKIF